MTTARATSWVSNEKDRDERLRHAERLVGLSISAVRYFDIDYGRFEREIKEPGPRVIADEAGWVSPSWRYDVADSFAFGLELETDGGRVFSVTWDPPGGIEGIGIREESLIGNTLLPGAKTAVWDVGERSRWHHHLGDPVSAVTMHYAPWDIDAGAWWCNRITILIGATVVELLLAEVAFETKRIAPSADEVLTRITDHTPQRRIRFGTSDHRLSAPAMTQINSSVTDSPISETAGYRHFPNGSVG